MSKPDKVKEPNLFDVVMNAFDGYSPGGVIRGDVLFLQRRHIPAHFLDADERLAKLNSQPLPGMVSRIEILENLS